ncbi:hypothetical protein C8R43DRAFT_1115818, partial [Mycena crocata]
MMELDTRYSITRPSPTLHSTSTNAPLDAQLDLRTILERNAKRETTKRNAERPNAQQPPTPAAGPDPRCAGLLAAAVGPTLTMLLHDHLHLLFGAGLSESLRVCLGQVARAIPPLLGVVQDRLLDLLSHILSGTPYVRLSAPAPMPQATGGGNNANAGGAVVWCRAEMGSGAFDALGIRCGPSTPDARVFRRGRVDGAFDPRTNTSGTAGGGPPPSKELLTLALNTLGSFDFSGHVLTEFAQTNALPYVEDDAPEVRRAAALACCRLFGAAAGAGEEYGITPAMGNGHGGRAGWGTRRAGMRWM